MKILTPAERARRAAVLGIILPGPPAPDAAPLSAPTPRPSGRVRAPIAGKLTAPAALRTRLKLPVAEPLPQPEPKPPAPAAAPPPVDRPSWRDRKRGRYKQARRLLASRWPAIFSAARPLAIGIDKRVRAILSEDEISTADLRMFFSIWTHRDAYRAALARGDRRVNLDGSDAGPAFDAPQDGVNGAG